MRYKGPMRHDELRDAISEERNRGKKQPVDVDELRKQEDRRLNVLEILHYSARQELQSLLKAWGYAEAEIENALRAYDAARDQQSF